MNRKHAFIVIVSLLAGISATALSTNAPATAENAFIEGIKSLNKAYADLGAVVELLGDATVGGYGKSGGLLKGMGMTKEMAKLGKSLGVGSDFSVSADIAARIPATFPS